jgi:S1-C subfamily serine protease
MRVLSLIVLTVILLIGVSGCWGGDEEDVVASEPTAEPEPTATEAPEPTATPVQELSWEDIVEKLEPSTVMVRADFPETAVSYEGQGSGTGIVYSEDGYILTNAHVVSGAAAITVATAGSTRERSARFIGISTCDDLAVIQVSDMDGLEPATLGNSSEERVGAEVAALGYPLGEMLSLDLSVSRGVISKMNEAVWEFESLIQHDATINDGNSGGPLVNRKGEVIGINTASVDPQQASSINFAIDINQAQRILADLEGGKNRNWLGMNLEPNFYADYFGTEEGLVVAAVASGSSASKVGVRAPYLLTHLEGLTVNSMEDVCKILRSHSDGDALKVEFMHIAATEMQFLEGEIVLGDDNRGTDLEIVHTVSFGTEPGATDPGTGTDDELTAGVWEGTATVVLDYWGQCDGTEWELLDTQTFAHDVRVIVDVPFEGEANPFWLEVFTESEDEGGFWILSSWEYTEGFYDYWELEMNGADIYGVSFDYAIEDFELGNVIYSYTTADPCSDAQDGSMSEMAIDTGSQIAGTLGTETGTLQITGMTADLLRDFSITMELVRVQ